MRRKTSVIAFTLLGGWLLLCAALFFGQRALIFPAPTERATSRQMKEYRLPGGSFLLASMVEGDGPVVVHFHGNAEQVAWLDTLAVDFHEQGISFVAVEYPGYPGAPGVTSERSMFAAAEEALQLVTSQLNVPRARLVLEGQSIGTGVAVAMAAQGWGSKLVLLSPYTRLADVAGRVITWAPVRLLLKDPFDSLSRAPRVTVPVLVFHGTADEVIPYELGETLSKAFPHAQLHRVEGAHHNDLWEQPGLFAALVAFVRS